MAGIEDFVVAEIAKDLEEASPQTSQSPLGPPAPGSLEEAIARGDTTAQARLSPFFAEAQYAGRMKERGGLPEGAVADPTSPLGFTIADPRLREQYIQYQGKLAAGAAVNQMMDRAYRERDKAKMQIVQGLRGLDPQIQATVLRRLGIDAGPITSKLDQQKELAAYQAKLAEPYRRATAMLSQTSAAQRAQQAQQELRLKQRALAEKTAGSERARNVQIMGILATLMQNDPRLRDALAPALMQLMQQSGINLATPTAGTTGSPEIKITERPR